MCSAAGPAPLSCSLRTGAGEKDSKKDKGGGKKEKQKGGKKEKGKDGKKEKGKDGKKEDKGGGKEKKGKGDGKGDGGKKGDGDAESQDGDAKSSKKALKDLKKQSTKDAGSKSGMLNTEDREVMEKLGAAMSKDKSSDSAQSASADMEQSGDSSPTKSADKKGVFSVLGGTSLGVSMGQSKDVEETKAEKEQRLAAERDEHLEKRRSAKQSILYAYGGAKRGWLIQLFDVDTKALLDKKSGKKSKGKDESKKSGKTFMDSEVIYCVARQTSALGEFYTFDSDEVSRACVSSATATVLSRSSSVLCRRRRKEIRTAFLAR